jgi:hypothetical protein
LVYVVALFSICTARPQYYQHQQGFQQKPFVPILAYNNDVSHDGSYAYRFVYSEFERRLLLQSKNDFGFLLSLKNAFAYMQREVYIE